MHKGRALLKRRTVMIGSVIACTVMIIAASFIITKPFSTKAADLSANYTWKSLPIGGGGWVTGLVVHPTTPDLVYARTDVGGAYRWDEGSQRWTQLLQASTVPNPIAGDYNVEAVAVSKTNDQVVYLSVGANDAEATGRVLKSTDRGQSWSASNRNWIIAGNNEFRVGTDRLAVDPNNENIVYLGTRKEGLWVSSDGANNWSQVPTDAIPVGTNEGHAAGITFVLFDESSSAVDGKTQRLYVGVAGHGVYRSDNGGSSWVRAFESTDVPVSADIAEDGTLVFTSGSTVQKYTPGTNSWTNIAPSAAGGYNVALDPKNSQRMFASLQAVRDGNTFRTTNGGQSWDTLDINWTSSDMPWIINTDADQWLSVGNIAFDPHNQDRVWFAEGMGVWRSTDIHDSEVTWDFVSKGIEEMVTNDIVVPPGGKPVTAVMDRIGFYHGNLDASPERTILSPKFSSGWSLDYSGGTPGFIASVASDHRWLNPDLSGYSLDGGQTWTQFSGSSANADLYGGNIAVSATDTNNIVWLPTWGKQPHVTNDRGATWTKPGFFNGIDGLHSMVWWGSKRALTADKVEGGTFYVYSTRNGGEFYRSTDGGQNWEKTPGQAPSSAGNDAHVFGQIQAVPGYGGHVWGSSAQGGLYYTTNKGDAWTKLDAVQDARAISFGKAIGSYPTVFVHAKINDQWGIWRSTDQGTNWDLVSAHPLNLYDKVHVLSGDPEIAGRVYVGFAGNSFVYGDSNLQ